MTTPAAASLPLAELPVVVVGAGPVGLAAAAHLQTRGLTPLVLESGDTVGSVMRQWGHIRTFTPWQYIVDEAAEKLLAPTDWTRPAGIVPPTGAAIVESYLEPLAAALGPDVGPDRRRMPSRRAGRETRPKVRRPPT